MELLKLSITNLVALIGTFVGFGLCFGFIENINNKLIFSAFGKIGIIITGAIGTVVHEASHLIMALIFGHKIEEVKFFKPFTSSSDGILGYVNHSYNKNNLYHNIGNFFIGIAPLIGGTIAIFLLFKFLVPQGYSTLNDSINIERYANLLKTLNIGEFIRLLALDFVLLIKLLITNFNIRTFMFIIFMYSISTHMGLSGADLKGSLNGMIFIFIVAVIFSLFKLNLFTGYIISYNIYVAIFMALGLLFSIVTLGISYIFSLIF